MGSLSPLTYADPISGAPPRPGVGKAWWRFKHRLRSLVAIRRGFRVGRFYYKETSTELLARALSRKGRGEKEYRVTFPDGSKLLLHCSRLRPYADIIGPVLLGHLQRAQAMIRPGMRVLALPAGTGYIGAWLRERVGPSGAIVALDSDQESIAFALRRYASPNIAFEVGDERALAGEVDGSFAACFVATMDRERIRPALLNECWRVIAPGGWMLIACPAEQGRADLEPLIRSLGVGARRREDGPSADAPSDHADLSGDDSGYDLPYTAQPDSGFDPHHEAPPRDPPRNPPRDAAQTPPTGDVSPVIDWLSAPDDGVHLVVVRKLGE